jgi:hypothetical protein
MKIKTLLNTTLIALILIAAVSCKKETKETEKEKEPEPDFKSLVEDGEWEITNLRLGDFAIWNSPLVEACTKDNIYTFLPSGILRTNEGEVKCNEDDPQEFDSGWEMIGNNKIYLEISITIEVKDTATILSINEQTMELQINSMDQDARVTLSKKQ